MTTSFCIQEALRWGVTHIQFISDNANLEAEILLAHVMQVSRSHLHAWPEKCLSQLEHDHYVSAIQRRQQQEPIAYITGIQEFWSLPIRVTQAVLIPRPETELLVELTLEKLGSAGAITIADLGTGSGAIALALAHERPEWTVYASDRMADALALAKQNARQLQLNNVQFCEGSWCAALPPILFDAIISNPPYIAIADTEVSSQVVATEPASALWSGVDGLQDLRLIISGAKSYLKSGAYLILEHGYTQASAVQDLMREAGYTEINVFHDLAGLDRVTIGRYLNN